MARPSKQGADYFPLDVHLDDKFKFIEIKYKLEGFAILIKLLQKIYSCGYWYKWTDDEALLFSDEIRTDFQLVKDVVSECVTRGVFDETLFEKYNILTSKGIQKRYKEIVRRRKDVEVTEEYLLIDNISIVNDDINPTSSEQDDGKSTQSKVKESKVNKSNKNIYVEVINHLNEKAGTKFKPTTRKTKEIIDARVNEKFTADDMKLVIDYCCKEWRGKIFTNGQKGDDYLQPSTLFNGKFEERLQKALKQNAPSQPEREEKTPTFMF